ncbi:MAG: RNA polymerase sigma factor [Bacteroidota bacterium]
MNDTDAELEAAWIRRCQDGDKEAFGKLVHKYMKQAYYVALGFVGSHEDALDLSQEAFVRAYKNLSRFQQGQRFFTWYYQILKNLSLNFLRDCTVKATPFSMMDGETVEAVADGAVSPDSIVEATDLRRAVWDALWQMDHEDRALLVARDMLDTPYEKLAELLDCPLGTVMSRLYYARKRLREKLNEVL